MYNFFPHTFRFVYLTTAAIILDSTVSLNERRGRRKEGEINRRKGGVGRDGSSKKRIHGRKNGRR